MSILLDSQTSVIVQGITGNEGTRITREMLAYGTKVAAGVTPGKGGQSVAGLPVYNTVASAVKKHPYINTSLIAVPPLMVKDAALEAIGNGIRLINILTERVPIQDTAYIINTAKKHKARIIGPSSIGIISPGAGKIGAIGGSDPHQIYTKGPVGVISKSGGMCAELSLILTQAGFGQSTVVGIGGDVIIGTTYAELLKLFAKDSETKAIVMYGEIGGTYEEEVGQWITDNKFSKPVVAFIAGRFAQTYLPHGESLGHAGAIIEGKRGTIESKAKALKKAGVTVVQAPYEIPVVLRKALKKKV